jgi:Zn-finger nucleic acid-binding protein
MMNRKNFGGASGVIVDVCARHGTWFDAGELPQVLTFVKSGGLVRERAREQQRQREAQAHEREMAGVASPKLAFDSLTTGGEHSSFAKDLLAFVVEVFSGHHGPR